VRMDKGVARVPESTRTKGKNKEQRHGDTAIAGALAWYAVQEIDGGEIDFQSTGVKREAITELSGF